MFRDEKFHLTSKRVIEKVVLLMRERYNYIIGGGVIHGASCSEILSDGCQRRKHHKSSYPVTSDTANSVQIADVVGRRAWSKAVSQKQA